MLRNFFHIFGKSLLTGVILGVSFASVSFVVLIGRSGFSPKIPEIKIPSISFISFSPSQSLLSPNPDDKENPKVLGNEINKNNLLSPLPDLNIETNPKEKNRSPKTVIGFLPFWTIKEATINYGLLDRIAYFGLGVEKDGNFIKTFEDGNEEPGLTGLKSEKLEIIIHEAKKQNVKVDLVLRLMNNDDIETLVNSPSKRKTLIKNTVAKIKERDLDGVNIDFEYVGAPENLTVKNFTTLVKEFKSELSKNPEKDYVVSVDTYADSVKKVRLYDIDSLGKTADFIIVMAYDFNQPKSFSAGPVAPLFGEEIYDYDVVTTVTDYLKNASSQKIVLGVPWYGYDWPVTDSKPNSKTLSGSQQHFAALSTFKRTKELIEKKGITPKWDEYGKSPWFSYFDQEEKVWRQVYYDDERSLSLKYSLVNEASLKGIAVWALGYEGNNNSLWQVVKEKLK